MKSNLKVHIIVMPTISEQWYQREDMFPLRNGSCTNTQVPRLFNKAFLPKAPLRTQTYLALVTGSPF